MKYLFFAKLLLLSTALLAQTGNFFLSHYAPISERFDNVCFDMAQDTRGILFFATNDGIQQFDGKEWELTPSTTGAIYSIVIHSSGDIFWSGSAGFGKIGKDSKGRDSVITLSSDVNDVFQSVAIDDHIYFINDESVFVLDAKTSAIAPVSSANITGSFTGIFELFGEAYVTTENGGVFKLSNDQLSHVEFNLPDGVDIFSTSKLDDKYVVLASNNRVYYCRQDLSLKEINLQDQTYADAGVIINMVWVNSQLLALGTLRGGVIFANPATGRTLEIVNYTTGLPDNEVFAMMTDNSQSIWVAHDYGFSRIAPFLPFRSFSHYPGLQGNLLCARSFHGAIYVGTSLGLFKLMKEDIYDEIVSYIDVEITQKPVRVQKKSGPSVVEVPVVEKTPEPESKKRRFFSFLRRKKEDKPVEKKETEPTKKEDVVNEGKAVAVKPVYRRQKRIDRVLRASQFGFKRVAGIDAKVTQLTEFDGRLIAAGLGGVFEVSDLASSTVITDPVRFVYGYESEKLLLASTYHDELKALHRTDKTWLPSPIFNDVDDQINFIFQGNKNELWLNALDKVYRLEVDSQTVTNIQTLSIANANLDETLGIVWRDRIIFTNANGFYVFDRQANAIVRMDTLPKPQTYFATGGNLWYRDSHRWNILGTLQEQSNLQLLNLFDDLRFISSDQTPDNLWLVTRKNELFKFYGERITSYDRGYPVYLKSIRNGEHHVVLSDDIELAENNGPLSFAVVQPDYTGLEVIEYRYRLHGLHQEWSEWSNKNNVLDFAYLPPTRYRLQIQARNIFGHVSDMRPVSFRVLPPYWKRSWFYALEFFVFAGLVILSYRLSTRYRFISRLLMLITIILLIEFIQTVAGATFASKESPVMDFFIQVGVALVILPVEGYLRNLMLRSIGSPEIHPILRTKTVEGEEKS
jgi:hypothetical protein